MLRSVQQLAEQMADIAGLVVQQLAEQMADIAGLAYSS